MKNFKNFNPTEIDSTFKEAQKKLMQVHEMKWVKSERDGQTTREAREIVLNGDYRLKKMSLEMTEGDHSWKLTVDDGIVEKSFNYKNTEDMLQMSKYIPGNMPAPTHHANFNKRFRVPKTKV